MEDRFPLPDENALVIPSSWRRRLHPRRGGTPVPAPKLDRRAVQTVHELSKEHQGAIASLLTGRHGNPDLAEAARRHLDGRPSPEGAAVLAAVITMAAGNRQSDETARAFFDSWVTEHGLGFAACALVELSRITAVRTGGGDWRGTWVGVEHREDRPGVRMENLRRARTLLAAADEGTYRDAQERLAGHRGTLMQRWVVSYLLPDRQDWVDECCAEQSPAHAPRWLLCHSLGRADQLTMPNGGVMLDWRNCSIDVIATLLEGLGTAALPIFQTALTQSYLESADRNRIFETLAVLPCDEAFTELLERLDNRHARAAAQAAMKRFPLRALRLLAAAAPASREAATLLAEHVAINADLIAAVRDDLPDEVRTAVESLVPPATRLPEAPAEAVPPILVELPWERFERPVVTGLKPPGPELVWQGDEREQRHDHGIDFVHRLLPPRDDPDWEALAEDIRNGDRTTSSVQFMMYGPEELVRPLLADLNLLPWRRGGGISSMLEVLLTRYGLDALPVVLHAVKEMKYSGEALVPIRHVEVAHLMCDRLTAGGAHSQTAEAWFARHGLAAVALLVPAALGRTAKRRRMAERGLRHLMSLHGLDEIVQTARSHYGDEAADALASVLGAHPLETGLTPPPKIGDWLTPAILPQVLLRDRKSALPVAAAQRLIMVLALSSPYLLESPPYGWEEVERACDPESLAEFGRALFQQWHDHGTPSTDRWALTQLRWTGNDETVRRLSPVIRAWPGKGGHRYAVHGLDVLAAIGSNLALLHLHGIAQKVKFTGLRQQAQSKIREVADRLGLSPEQLADRLVPDFGLDPSGGLVLDYGPRRFTVGFDEQLKPVVTDDNGKLRKSLPKPGAKDDPHLAPAAYQQFTALKKDVRTVAADQLRRLETAMATGRRWTPGEFNDFIVGHPLVWHLARRLVWICEDGDSVTAFRVAEDRTLADIDDEEFTLPGTARVGIAHPVHLGDTTAAWAQVFGDYEILQPFPQLTRPVYALTDAERDAGRLERFEGLKMPSVTVLGLTRRGWERGAPQDGGNQLWISRKVAEDRYVVIDLDPGFSAGDATATGDYQTLEYVWLATEPGAYWPSKGTSLRFGELDPVTASEILADLTFLADAAA